MNWMTLTAVISMVLLLAVTTWRDQRAVKEMKTEALFEELGSRLEKELSEYRSGSQPHPLVVHCLEAAIEHLSSADMAYYASFK